MRGRVAAFPFLFFFLIAPAAFPQCNLAPVYSGQFRSSVLDIAVDNTSPDLWAATSYGVSLYDRSVDPPKLVASLPVPGITRVVRVANGSVYAGSGSSIVNIRKNGSSLQIVNTLDAGGTVNDLLITPISIFAATSNGLFQIDLLDFHTVTLPTSSPNVTSIAASNTTLYAADGDDSVEEFSTSGIVQPIGTLTSGVKSAQVVRLNNNRVYVSDRIQKTAIFTDSGTLLTNVNSAFTAMAPLSGDAVYISTNDPRVHAVDFTTPGTPVEIFEQSGTPAGGTINRISALQRAVNRLYAAGGDLGLLTWDITLFAAPFPIHSYNDAPSTSVVAIGNSMFVSRLAGAIYEYKIASNGALTEGRHWDTRIHTMRDGSANGLLLSTTGTTAIVWTVSATTPVPIASVDFGVPADAAALVGSKIYVLSSKALFSADIADLTPKAVLVPLNGMKPSWIARAGNSLALAEETDDDQTLTAQTSIRLLTGTSLGNAAVVDGVPSAGVAANGNTVALFTFLGITLVDFSSNPATKTIIPNSTSSVALPQQLSFSGSTLLELTDTSLLAWNTTTRTLSRKFIVPASPAAIGGGNDPLQQVAVIATSDGVASIVLNSSTPMPALYPAPSGNSYYKKVVLAGKRMLLFDGRDADLFEITTAPRWIGSIRTGGLVDIAASDDAFYTLNGSGNVRKYSLDGTLLVERTIINITDSVPLRISVIRGVPWVAGSKDCLHCAEQTTLIDPQTLVPVGTQSGGIVDVSVDGNTAYAIVSLPNELRAINATDPQHPSVIAAQPVDAAAHLTAIAETNGTVYALGDKVYVYSTALAATGTFPSNSTTLLRVAGDCALLTGLTSQLYKLPAFTAAPTPGVPAPAQSLAVQSGSAFIVTDDSLEIWAATALATPVRRRPTR
jgi:hypothetical protein